LLDARAMTRTMLLLVLAATSPAFADPAPIDPVWPWTPADPGSYRLEVVAVDASAVAMLAIGHDSTAVVGLAIATYALGSPILHLVHHRPGNAVGSFALRVGLPLAGAALGYALTSGGPSSSDIPAGAGGGLIGLIGGVIAASAIDIGALAKDETAPRVAPAVTPIAHGGVTFGLGGAF
jgi:hypothetical protein